MNYTKYKVISKEEELKLGLKIKNGCNKSKEKLINSNLKIVPHIVKQFSEKMPHLKLDYDELIAVGNYELCKAAENFNPNFNVKFITYASHSIKNSIYFSIKNNIIHIPISASIKYKKIIKLKNQGLDKNQICQKLNLSKKEYSHIINQVNLKNPKSIYEKINQHDDDNTILADLIPDENNQNDIKEKKEFVKYCLNFLNNKQKIIIKLYYGIDSEPHTLLEIAKILNCSAENVRLIKEKAILKLKKIQITKKI